jgi:hypothetical protein
MNREEVKEENLECRREAPLWRGVFGGCTVTALPKRRYARARQICAAAFSWRPFASSRFTF